MQWEGKPPTAALQPHTKGDTVTISVDTTDALTTFDPALFVSDELGYYVGSAADSFTCTFPPPSYSCPEGDEVVQKMQVTLSSEGAPATMRDMSAEVVSRLVKIPGIVVAASGIKAKATRILCTMSASDPKSRLT